MSRWLHILVSGAAIAVVAAGCAEDHRGRGKKADDTEETSQAQGHRLAASATHACALRKAGIYCWGENFVGQLGDGQTVDSDVPVLATAAGTDVVDVVVSTARTCVRRSTGQVACWGANDYGQIGDGTRTDASTAVAAKGIDDALALAIDPESSCVLRRDHSVACWGNAAQGSPSVGSLLPTPIAGISHALELAAGGLGGYCVREQAGTVRCWRFEQEKWTTPELVPELEGARALTMSHFRTPCAVMPSGEIQCRRIDTGDTITLQQSAGFSATVSGGDLVACGISEDGRGRCWNVHPQFMLEVPSELPLLEISVAGLSACALRSDQGVLCMRAGSVLGLPVPVDVPLPD